MSDRESSDQSQPSIDATALNGFGRADSPSQSMPGAEINYRDVLDDLPAAIYTTDADGRINYFNKACVELSGRTPVIGSDFYCVTWQIRTLDGDVVEPEHCPMAITLAEKREVRGIEAIAVRPDGSTVNVKPYPTPIFDDSGEMIGAVNMLVDITEQKAAQERIALLAYEIDHRTSNLLAMMQGLMKLTKADTVDDYKAKLEGRFAAVARANALVAGTRRGELDVRSVVEDELRAFTSARVRCDGIALKIRPSAAQSLGMIIHELCTNAVKYGALSTDSGAVDVSWTVDDRGNLTLLWAENDGPSVCEPIRTGTGSRVIAGATRQLDAKATYDWRDTGLRCAFICPAASLHSLTAEQAELNNR